MGVVAAVGFFPFLKNRIFARRESLRCSRLALFSPFLLFFLVVIYPPPARFLETSPGMILPSILVLAPPPPFVLKPVLLELNPVTAVGPSVLGPPGIRAVGSGQVFFPRIDVSLKQRRVRFLSFYLCLCPSQQPFAVRLPLSMRSNLLRFSPQLVRAQL